MSDSANVSDEGQIMYPFLDKLEVTRWAEFALWLIVFGVGMPGNLLIICVYRAKRASTTTHVCIGALALADLLTCLLRLADAVLIASVSTFLEYEAKYAHSMMYFLGRGFLYSTAFLTTLIAFDRFDAVCRSRRRILSLKRSKITAVSCFVAGFVVILPEVGLQLHSTLNEEDADIFILSIVKFIPVALYIISLCFVTIFYGIIFFFVRKHRKIMVQNRMKEPSVSIIRTDNRPSSRFIFVTPAVSTHVDVATETQETTAAAHSQGGDGTLRSVQPPGGSHQQRPDNTTALSRTTKMLFIVTFLYFILWLPNVCLKIYALGGMYTDFLKSAYHANFVAALLVLREITYFNSTINAFIYGLANKRFRADCQALVKRLRVRF